MKKIYRLKNPVRLIQEQSRPIYWFPLIGVNLQGFILMFSILSLLILEIFSGLTPFHCFSVTCMLNP